MIPSLWKLNLVLQTIYVFYIWPTIYYLLIILKKKKRFRPKFGGKRVFTIKVPVKNACLESCHRFQEIIILPKKCWRTKKHSLLFSVAFFFFLSTEASIFFWEKLIGQWIPDRDGRWITRDIQKIIFIFQSWDISAF